jgi:hypothetical protein
MDTAQRDALAQWNATRPQRSLSAMEAAEQDHRVALADAHDAYESALAKAAQDLLAAAARADRAFALAKAQQRSDDDARARMADYYAHRPQAFLEQDLSRFLAMVSPGYGGHRDRTQDGQVRVHVELISAELDRRGADVS